MNNLNVNIISKSHFDKNGEIENTEVVVNLHTDGITVEIGWE